MPTQMATREAQRCRDRLRCQLNARLTWQSNRGGWQASLFISNLTDKIYYSTEQNLLSTYDAVTGQPGRPREALFSVRKSF